MTRRGVGFPILLALLAGCNFLLQGPHYGEHRAEAGQAPIDYEQTIRNYLRHTLPDPDGVADLSVSEPVLIGCVIRRLAEGSEGFFGWRVTTKYNAKNTYGAYVGLKTYYFWFRGEQLKGVGLQPTYCPEAELWR